MELTSISRHFRWHNKKDNKCETCDKQFVKATDLTRHRNKHLKRGEKMTQIECKKDGCTTTFTQKYNLPRHLRRTHKMSEEEIKAFITA